MILMKCSVIESVIYHCHPISDIPLQVRITWMTIYEGVYQKVHADAKNKHLKSPGDASYRFHPLLHTCGSLFESFQFIVLFLINSIMTNVLPRMIYLCVVMCLDFQTIHLKGVCSSGAYVCMYGMCILWI